MKRPASELISARRVSRLACLRQRWQSARRSVRLQSQLSSQADAPRRDQRRAVDTDIRAARAAHAVVNDSVLARSRRGPAQTHAEVLTGGVIVGIVKVPPADALSADVDEIAVDVPISWRIWMLVGNAPAESLSRRVP